MGNVNLFNKLPEAELDEEETESTPEAELDEEETESTPDSEKETPSILDSGLFMVELAFSALGLK